MNSTSDDLRVLLFPSCDRDGLLLDAIERADDGPATRADAMLFGWMLGLDAAIDAVGAARAVLAVVAHQPPRRTTSPYREALIEGLERFVADRGRVASLSGTAASGGVISGGLRPRRRWRDRVAHVRSSIGAGSREPAESKRDNRCRNTPGD